MAALTLVMLLFADVTAWSLHPLYKWRLARTFAGCAAWPTTDAGARPSGPVQAAAAPQRAHARPVPRAPNRSAGVPELLVCASVNVSDQGTTPPGQSSLASCSARRGRVRRPVVVPEPTSWWRWLLVPGADRGARPRRSARWRCRPPTTSGAVGERADARHHDLGRRRHVGGGDRPVHGEDDPGAAPVPLALDQRPARRVAAEPRHCRCSPHRSAGARQPAAGPPARTRWSDRHRVRSVPVRHRRRHIENLGLLELLRRGCRTIVCLDAAGGIDPHVLDAGRGDRAGGVRPERRIDIDPARPEAEREANASRLTWSATIRYAAIADRPSGRLIYGKALVTAESRGTCRPTRAKDARFRPPDNRPALQRRDVRRLPGPGPPRRRAVRPRSRRRPRATERAERPPTSTSGAAAGRGHGGDGRRVPLNRGSIDRVSACSCPPGWQAAAMTLQVIQWATGGVGRAAIEGVLAHPDLELVGLLGPQRRQGRPGRRRRWSGVDPIGVAATADVDALLALDADCVVYSPLHGRPRPWSPASCARARTWSRRSAGSTRPRRRARALEAACAEGGVTLHGTGIHPGGITERFPLMVSALSRAITHVRAEEFSDIRTYGAPDVVRDIMLFGGHPRGGERRARCPTLLGRRLQPVGPHGRRRAGLRPRPRAPHDPRGRGGDGADRLAHRRRSSPGRSRRSASAGRPRSTASR